MKILAVHPSGLMYTKIFLRLEPLGLEIAVGVARDAGHDVKLIDLQVETHSQYFRVVRDWQPDVIAFSCNYLANVPEIIDLAIATKAVLPRCFIMVGGHSASFTAREIIEHGKGAIDCVLKGEGEAVIEEVLEAVMHDRKAAATVPGVVTAESEGPPPRFVSNLDDQRAARDLLRHRHQYFIGVLEPCASIEFSRGCPWDCTFCSAWTFYGRSYRAKSPSRIVEELSSIREPGIFIVDDVAFVQAKHGFEIGERLASKGIKKQYYLETRGDVLLRNKDVFRFWASLGLKYMFIGLEAIDEEGLQRYRKRVSLSKNFEALEFARSLGIVVAVNIIAEPDWDRDRFETVRRWSLEVPEVVNISVSTPYPGTETWRTEARRLHTRDYRLFDIQHAVLPTRLPLPEFYAELVKTQQVMNRKHLGWKTLVKLGRVSASHLLRGQTNFLRMLFKFNSVFDPALQLADHERPVRYEIAPPPPPQQRVDPKALYVHRPQGRKGRAALDDQTERFVDETRTGAAT
jgi:hopanoid C-3 methylase HpnR